MIQSETLSFFSNAFRSLLSVGKGYNEQSINKNTAIPICLNFYQYSADHSIAAAKAKTAPKGTSSKSRTPIAEYQTVIF